MKNRIKA